MGLLLLNETIVRKQRRGSPVLRVLGVLVFIYGLIYGIFYWQFFDTSVQVPSQEIFGQVIGGQRVHNIGLLQDKQNGILLGFGAAAVGFIVALLGEYANVGQKR